MNASLPSTNLYTLNTYNIEIVRILRTIILSGENGFREVVH